MHDWMHTFGRYNFFMENKLLIDITKYISIHKGRNINYSQPKFIFCMPKCHMTTIDAKMWDKDVRQPNFD